MKKYNILYAKKTAVWFFSIFASISLLFLIVALFADSLSYDLLVSLVFLFIGLLLWALNLLRIPFAIRLFKVQATQLNVTFDDSDAKALYPSSMIFLTNSWFIASGRLYLHKDFIQSMTVKTRKSAKGNDYYCVFKSNDGTHTIHVDSSSSAKKIKNWVGAKT